MKKKNNLNFFKKIKKDFDGIYKACGKKFWYSCGSYLIDGKKYKYDKRMLKKQILLFNLAKKNQSILEVGVYMGHSMLLMLKSNPKLKIRTKTFPPSFFTLEINPPQPKTSSSL